MEPSGDLHPLTRFSLVPLNDRAKAVTTRPTNAHIARRLADGTTVLDIGRVLSISGNTALVTLGRAGDVLVEGTSVSRLQCSFEVDPDSDFVLFHDHLRGQNSSFRGRCYPI
jgi:hypothetical protein